MSWKIRASLTSFKLVRFSIVSNVRSLGFGNLHLAIFLCLGQSEIFFVPLQARGGESVNRIFSSTIRAWYNGGSHRSPGLPKDIDRRIRQLTAGY